MFTPRPVRLGAPYALAIVVGMAVAGCGYKAPLYLPKPKAERARPAPAVVTPETPQDRPVPSEATPLPQ